MKLLLTSGGITNTSIASALFDLVGKKPEDTSLVFIPTAANAEKGDKEWFIDDLVNLKKQNFKSIDIADISAVDEKIWRPKFEEAVIREVFEEVGLNLIELRRIGEYTSTKEYKKDTVIVFTAQSKYKNVKIDQKEIAEATWFKSDNLPEISEYSKAILAML